MWQEYSISAPGKHHYYAAGSTMNRNFRADFKFTWTLIFSASDWSQPANYSIRINRTNAAHNSIPNVAAGKKARKTSQKEKKVNLTDIFLGRVWQMESESKFSSSLLLWSFLVLNNIIIRKANRQNWWWLQRTLIGDERMKWKTEIPPTSFTLNWALTVPEAFAVFAYLKMTRIVWYGTSTHHSSPVDSEECGSVQRICLMRHFVDSSNNGNQ